MSKSREKWWYPIVLIKLAFENTSVNLFEVLGIMKSIISCMNRWDMKWEWATEKYMMAGTCMDQYGMQQAWMCLLWFDQQKRTGNNLLLLFLPKIFSENLKGCIDVPWNGRKKKKRIAKLNESIISWGYVCFFYWMYSLVYDKIISTIVDFYEIVYANGKNS